MRSRDMADSAQRVAPLWRRSKVIVPEPARVRLPLQPEKVQGRVFLDVPSGVPHNTQPVTAVPESHMLPNLEGGSRDNPIKRRFHSQSDRAVTQRQIVVIRTVTALEDFAVGVL